MPWPLLLVAAAPADCVLRKQVDAQMTEAARYGAARSYQAERQYFGKLLCGGGTVSSYILNRRTAAGAEPAFAPPKAVAPPEPLERDTWERPENAPVAVRVNGWAGSRDVRLFVNGEGEVERCEVLAPLDNRDANKATCDALRARRFTPPHDREGKPTLGAYDTRIAWHDLRPYPAAITPAAPRSPIHTWVASDDYPFAALRAEQQGAVTYKLLIGPDGRVAQCVVTGSSGFVALDDGTCRLLERRGRFVPALAADGQATVDWVASRMIWKMAAD